MYFCRIRRTRPRLNESEQRRILGRIEKKTEKKALEINEEERKTKELITAF